MPNTRSAEKALRQTATKKAHNTLWKNRVRDIVKTINAHIKDKADTAIIKKDESLLYKVVDKAAKVKALHVNKARRLKSKISKRIAVHASTKPEEPITSGKERSKAKSTRTKSKS